MTIGIITMIVLFVTSLGLFLFTYFMDKIEKEPFKLLLILFFSAMGLGIVIYAAEFGLDALLKFIMRDYCSKTTEGETVWYSYTPYNIYNLITSYFIKGLPEVISIFVLVFLITHKNKEYNYTFDGMVYMVTAFAGFYIMKGIILLIHERANLALEGVVLPAGLFAGVIMGLFYSLYKVHAEAKPIEERRIKHQIYKSSKLDSFFCIYAGILISGAVLGSWYFTLFDDMAGAVVLLALTLGLVIFSIITIVKMSKKDKPIKDGAENILKEAHKK